MKTGLAVAAALLVMTPGIALAKEKKNESAEATSEDGKEKKICRSELAIGSILRKNRICMTASEWAKLEHETQDQINRLQGSQAMSQKTE